MGAKSDGVRHDVERALKRVTLDEGDAVIQSPDARRIAEAIDKLIEARIAEALAGRS